MDSETLERFLVKIDTSGSCWLWLAAKDREGYGQFKAGGKQVKAHRFSYENLGGNKIPDGNQIDHLCRNKSCVNPVHLEAVTPRENTVRHRSLIVECPQGHPYDEANTYTNSRGQRSCRTCQRDASRDRARTRRAALATTTIGL